MASTARNNANSWVIRESPSCLHTVFNCQSLTHKHCGISLSIRCPRYLWPQMMVQGCRYTSPPCSHPNHDESCHSCILFLGALSLVSCRAYAADTHACGVCVMSTLRVKPAEDGKLCERRTWSSSCGGGHLAKTSASPDTWMNTLPIDRSLSSDIVVLVAYRLGPGPSW